MATARRMRPAAAAARGAQAAQATAKGFTEERGQGRVSTAYKRSNEVIDETDREVQTEGRRFAAGEHPAYVKVGAGLTINMGNFESLRVDCSISLPCHATEDDIAATYEQASDFVSDRMAEEQERWLPTTPAPAKRTR